MNLDWGATLIALTIFFGIAALIALSLNLEYGVAGLPNFGQALFVSVGAYTAGVTYSRLLPWLGGRAAIDPCGESLAQSLALRSELMRYFPDIGFLNFAITLIAAAALGGLLGYGLSFVALRVKEEWYLGLLLLVTSEVARTLVRGNPALICGYNGLAGIAQPFGWIADTRLSLAVFAVFILVLVALAYAYCEKLVRSPYGRLLKALRENEAVTAGLGKPVARVRAQVMAIGSAIAAVAGVLFAANLGFVSTNDFGVEITLEAWVMVVLGGLGSNRGALLGALVVTVLNRLTSIIAIQLNALGSDFEFNYVRYIIFAFLLLLMLRFRRQGLLPESPRTTAAHELLRHDPAAQPELSS